MNRQFCQRSDKSEVYKFQVNESDCLPQGHVFGLSIGQHLDGSLVDLPRLGDSKELGCSDLLLDEEAKTEAEDN